MNDLVLYIVKSIVNNPDAVSVSDETIDHEVRISLSVAPEDMGIIIGKAGQNIKAIRKLLTVRAMADNVRVYLQLVEPEGQEQPASEDAKEEETPKEAQAPAAE